MLTIVQAPAELSLSKTSMKYILQASDSQTIPYSSATIPDAYEVTIQIYFEKTLGSGQFQVVATLKQKPDSNGQVEIDVSNIIDNEIQSNFSAPPIPTFDQDQPYVLPTYKNYYISYKEDYTDFAGAFANSGNKAALYGGVYQEVDFFADRDQNNAILSEIPKRKLVDEGQPEFIAWYNWTGVIKRVFVDINQISSSGQSTPLAAYSNNTIDVNPGQILIFPIGMTTLNLLATTREYSIQVAEQLTDSRMSEVLTFKVDTAYRRNKRYLCYLNIFAAPMVLRCTGAQTRGLDIDRKIAAVLQNSNSILRYADQQFEVDFLEYFLFRTGYMDLESLKSLDDLLIHNQVYEISANGFTPLLIQKDTFSYNEDDFLFSLEFRCKLSASNSFGAGQASVNWNIAGGDGSGATVSLVGYDQLYPNQQSNVLTWLRNGGELPEYTRAFFRLEEDGVILTEGRDFSISRNTAPGESQIIVNPDYFIPGANYKAVAQYLSS